MPKRVPLPSSLHSSPFRVQTARDAGIGKRRLDGTDLARPFHGVRIAAGAEVHPARAYAPLLHGSQHFSHLTAAALYGVPLPFLSDSRVHVTSVAPARAPAGRGVAGHQTADARRHVVIRHRLPVVDPVTLFCELAPLLGLDDLVAVGDHLLFDPPVLDPLDLRPYATLEQLVSRVAGFRGRGARAAASALLLCRVGSASRKETQLRLLLMRAGLPEPELNTEITDDRGRFLAYGDLVYREKKVLVEYDGDQHRTSQRQFERDHARLDALRDAGWTIIQVRRDGLNERTVERVRRALGL